MREEWVSVALAAAAIFCMGGVIFGIASLYPVLYYERAFQHSSCNAAEEQSCSMRSAEKCCDAQQLQYTFVTSVALFAADGAMLLYGELGDRLGPRACFGVGASLAWSGLALLSLAASMGADWLWSTAMLLLGGSGPGVFMGCLYLGEKHPAMRAVISAVGASMWDASALVFMLFNTVYFAGAADGELPAVGLHAISIAWGLLCAGIGISTWKALPTYEELQQLRSPDASDLADAHQDGSVRQELSPQDGGEGEVAKMATPEDGGAGDARPFLAVFLRTDTLLLLFFMASYNLKSSFYISTFADQMAQMLAPSTVVSLSTTFYIAFPLGGFVTSFGAALLLERLGEREDLYMALVVLLAIMLGIYNLLPFAASQLASAVLFGPTRTVQWACYFHFLSLPKRYPPQYVGRLLGYGNLVIALAGDLPVGPLNAFVTNSTLLGSAAARYLLVHFVLQLLVIAGLVLPWHLYQNKHPKGRHLLSLLPGDEEATFEAGSAMEMLPADAIEDRDRRCRSGDDEETGWQDPNPFDVKAIECEPCALSVASGASIPSVQLERTLTAAESEQNHPKPMPRTIAMDD